MRLGYNPVLYWLIYNFEAGFNEAEAHAPRIRGK